MSDTLRDQLLGLGFKPAPKPERKPETGRRDADRQGPRKPEGKRPHAQQARGGKPPGKGGRSQQDIDLAKAYAIRSQREKEERIEAERLKQEQARQRREAKARLDELLKDAALNAADAEIARHFPYGGKIKRIYVTEAQLKALNAGELGVVQQNGRYLLVTAALLAQAEAIFPAAIALRIDPDAPAEQDPYSDPKYQVPDDLIW
ncbi:DUF2058 domain-containing protein [Pseudoxanthomonas mexicana]|uniref:DUF2058 domain-containing protein n=1 Tax=Pseudoxanthomonas mexicana TaxID=128785 RepID=UPI00398B4B40